MTSTSQLSVGARLSLTEIKSAWLKLNHDSGRDIHVIHNVLHPQARYMSACYTAPKVGWDHKPDECCNAHIKAVGRSRHDMEIISFDPTHTCSGTESKRKRNYRTNDICCVSDVLAVYEPAKSGNAKQFAKMTKTATGMSLKTGQSHLAVKQRVGDTVEAAIGQYFWLRSVIDAYKESDSEGTFHLEDVPCPWNQDIRQFHRCYICLGIAKHFWKNARIDLLINDGTFTRSNYFKHIILISTTFDGNNQIVVLAFAIVDCENSENWIWFKEHLEQDFPRMKVWMSDADKGIHSNSFSLSMSQSTEPFVLSRCARHLAENCKESSKAGIKMNEHHKTLITELGKSTNWDLYEKRLGGIRSVSEKWAEYLDQHKTEFVAASFLDRGYSRWGKVTSNGVETINGVFGEARGLPIVFLMEHLVDYQRCKYHERHTQAAKWIEEGKRLTTCAGDIQRRLADKGSRKKVDVIEANHPIYRARVQSSLNFGQIGFIEVRLNVNTRQADCPCKYYDEMGISCAHIKAVLLSLNKTTTWCNPRYCVETYSASYSAPIPSMIVAKKLCVDETLAPPDYRRPAGRPSKKRKDRSYYRTTAAKKTCSACGSAGHYAVSCTAPDTKYRYDRFRNKAIQWCRLAKNEMVSE